MEWKLLLLYDSARDWRQKQAQAADQVGRLLLLYYSARLATEEAQAADQADVTPLPSPPSGGGGGGASWPSRTPQRPVTIPIRRWWLAARLLFRSSRGFLLRRCHRESRTAPHHGTPPLSLTRNDGRRRSSARSASSSSASAATSRWRRPSRRRSLARATPRRSVAGRCGGAGAARAHGRPVGSSRPSGGRRQPPTVRTRRRRAGWRRANDSAPSRSDPRDEEERTARPPGGSPPPPSSRRAGEDWRRHECVAHVESPPARRERACSLTRTRARLCSAPGVLPA